MSETLKDLAACLPDRNLRHGREICGKDSLAGVRHVELKPSALRTQQENNLVSPSAGSADPGPGPIERVCRARFLHIFPSFGLGGVPIRIANIINYLGARYHHTIVALDDCYDAASHLSSAADCTFWPALEPNTNLLRSIARKCVILRQIKPDLLLTYNWGAIEWAMANRVRPVCRHVHLESGFGREEADQQLWRRVLLRRIALAHTVRMIVPSQNLMKIAAETWKIDRKKITLIANGVNCDKFRGLADPSILSGFNKRDGQLIIGTVAPLRPEKNMPRLLRAFSTIAERYDVKLIVVGDGTERPRLIALAKELGIAENVLFPGHISRVEKVLDLFDVFALASDTEQMPNSVIQAMAAGRPIVATDVGDIREMVAMENRPFIVPKEQGSALSTALDKLLADRSVRVELGRHNQLRAQTNYSELRMFQAYEAIFSDLLEDRI